MGPTPRILDHLLENCHTFAVQLLQRAIFTLCKTGEPRNNDQLLFEGGKGRLACNASLAAGAAPMSVSLLDEDVLVLGAVC